MSPSVRAAIEKRIPEAQFVSGEEVDALFGSDHLVAGGQGVLVTVGPPRKLADGVVGIEVGIITARDGGHGQVRQFQRRDGAWIPATSDETGVTVTSWVS